MKSQITQKEALMGLREAGTRQEAPWATEPHPRERLTCWRRSPSPKRPNRRLTTLLQPHWANGSQWAAWWARGWAAAGAARGPARPLWAAGPPPPPGMCSSRTAWGTTRSSAGCGSSSARAPAGPWGQSAATATCAPTILEWDEINCAWGYIKTLNS